MFFVDHSYVIDCAAKLKPDVISYSAVISACEKGSKWEVALHFFDAMKGMRFQRLKMWRLGDYFILKISDAVSTVENRSKLKKDGLTPNVIAYNCDKNAAMGILV